MKPTKITTSVALFLFGTLLIHGFLLWQVHDVIAKGYPDFTTFYMAGKMVRTGMGHELYDLAAEWRVQQEFAPWVSTRQAALPYMHAPFEALLFVPFSVLPYGIAFAAWDAINLLILWMMPYLLRPHLPVLGRLSPLLFIAIELAFFPVFFVLLQGQDAILLLLFYALTYVSLRRGAETAAGVWLACGLFRFHLVLPFVVVMLFARKFRLVTSFSVAALGLAGLSAWIVGWRQLLHYPGYIWWLEQHKSRVILTPSDTTNIRGLLDTMLAHWLPESWLLGAVILGSAITLYFAIRVWPQERNPPAGIDLAFSVTLLGTILVGYHSFLYDFSVLLIPIAIMLGILIPGISAARFVRIASLVAIFALFCTPLYLFLWFRLGHPNLMALFLILWLIALLRLVSPIQMKASMNASEPTARS